MAGKIPKIVVDALNRAEWTKEPLSLMPRPGPLYKDGVPLGAALKMKVEDLRPKGAGWQIRLHEKGGKQHAMPCHHALAEALHAYI